MAGTILRCFLNFRAQVCDPVRTPSQSRTPALRLPRSAVQLRLRPVSLSWRRTSPASLRRMLPWKQRDGLEGRAYVHLSWRSTCAPMCFVWNRLSCRCSNVLLPTCVRRICVRRIYGLRSCVPGLFFQHSCERDRAFRGSLTCEKQILSTSASFRPSESRLFFLPSNRRATIFWLLP
jgi:hypothetical protein